MSYSTETIALINKFRIYLNEHLKKSNHEMYVEEIAQVYIHNIKHVKGFIWDILKTKSEYNSFMEEHLNFGEHSINMDVQCTINDIEKAELRLGVKFPPSYKKLMQEIGVLNVGHKKFLELDELKTLKQALEDEWRVDWKTQHPDFEKTTEKLIVFTTSNGADRCFYQCMNYHSLNADTRETNYTCFDQGDFGSVFPIKETSFSGNMIQKLMSYQIEGMIEATRNDVEFGLERVEVIDGKNRFV